MEKIIKKLTIFGVDIEKYSIVVDENAPKGLLDAVENLKKYIFDGTGVKLNSAKYCENENQIVVGFEYSTSQKCKQAKDSIKYDGFAIVGENNKLFITANDYRAVAIGIYAFLEEFVGVRYFSSTYVVINPANKIDIEKDICYVSSPKMDYRNIFWADVKHPNHKNPQFATMLRDNNCDFSDFGETAWYVSGEEISAHTLVGLAEMKHEVGLQPCLSDENVYQKVLKNAKKSLKENPKARILSISQNDSWAHQLGCQCEKCRAIDQREGTPMGSLLTFVNRIADDIKDEYPDVLVETLAYRYTRRAPKTVVPRDNVIVRLCSIECCFCHPFTDINCEKNTSFKKDVEEWGKIAKKYYVWDYTTNFHKYMLPFPNLHVMHKNIKFFVENNVTGVFAQGNEQSLSAEFGELRAYLLSKLLWNPDMSEKEYFAYMDEFLQGYYGAGWKRIRSYIDWTSEFSAKKTHAHCETSEIAIPFDNKEQCESWIAEWRKAVEEAETEVQKEHVRVSMVQLLSLSEHFPEFGFDFREEKYHILKRNGITYYRVNARLPELKEGEEMPWLK